MTSASSWSVLGATLIVYSMANAAVIPENEVLARQAVSHSLGEFGSDFYKQVYGEETGNLICSPLSAGVVLSMTYFGAGGNTENQMRTALRIPEDRALTQTGFRSLITSLNSAKKVALSLANKVFTATGFEVKPEFKQVTDRAFLSESESVDFSDTTAASQTINTWCEQQTNNRITDVLKPDDLVGALIVLVNAVYFKGNWASKFNPQLTQPQAFHVDASTTKDVPMMFKKADYNTGLLEDLDARYIELPYEHESDNDAISMFIILPNEVEGLKKAQSKLGNVNFQLLHQRNTQQEARLYLPKFKVESTLELQPVLEKMGMRDMFSDFANFTGITESPPLKISKVIQKAFIEVNEEGSEAAAVTGVAIVPLSAVIGAEEPLIIKVERPFLYAIHHTSLNTVLFQGHINLPKMQ